MNRYNFSLFSGNSGRLPDSARTYGEVFINGVRSRLPYGAYVSPVQTIISCDWVPEVLAYLLYFVLRSPLFSFLSYWRSPTSKENAHICNN